MAAYFLMNNHHHLLLNMWQAKVFEAITLAGIKGRRMEPELSTRPSITVTVPVAATSKRLPVLPAAPTTI